MPNNAAVTVVKIKNFTVGTREICDQRLTTSAVEHPMISRPPMISPQRILLCSMNAASTSAKGLRGGGGFICAYGGTSSESLAHGSRGGTGSAGGRLEATGSVTTEGGGGGAAGGTVARTGGFSRA